MFNWKYALVLVEERQGKQFCEIYELHQDVRGSWTTLSKASVDSLGDIEKLYADVKSDGINRWFYDNGTFLYHPTKEIWEWEKNEAQGVL